jgi:hypothetical protein
MTAKRPPSETMAGVFFWIPERDRRGRSKTILARRVSILKGEV